MTLTSGTTMQIFVQIYAGEFTTPPFTGIATTLLRSK